jgi:hypothetical protein
MFANRIIEEQVHCFEKFQNLFLAIRLFFIIQIHLNKIGVKPVRKIQLLAAVYVKLMYIRLIASNIFIKVP